MREAKRGGERQSLVDRLTRRVIDDNECLRRWRRRWNGRTPRRDRPILRGKDEARRRRRRAVGHLEPIGTVVNNTGWRGWRIDAHRRGNGHVKRSRRTGSIVQRRYTASVDGKPCNGVGAKRQTPRILQVRIG